MNEVSPEQAFNLHRTPGHLPVDGEPRLRGDILAWQLLTAYTPAWLFEVISVTWGLFRLALWELPRVAIEMMILDPIKRWRKR